MNFSKTIISGRCTNDIELKTTQSNVSYCNFGVAVNDFYKGEKTTMFYRVVLWGKQAEVAAQYLQKGQIVLIDGKLKERRFKDNNGVEQVRIELHGNQMQMGPKAGESQSQQQGGQQGFPSQPAPTQQVAPMQQQPSQQPPQQGQLMQQGGGSEEVNINEISW